MPYYVEKREELDSIRRRNVCAECGSTLLPYYDARKRKYYLQCISNSDHNGIAREYKEPKELNIPTRREQLTNEHGEEKGKALMRYPATGQLTKTEAMDVLRLVYPDVPDEQIVRTAILCKDFGLHPLMKEVYIIPFKDKEGKATYSTVLGINATRKMTARLGTFSYADNTPRVMTPEEQETIFGEVFTDRIYAITKLRTKDGLQAQGYGFWMKDKQPYGTDKGNTKANMAFIRSERQAFSRLFPDSIPQEVDIVDEEYVDTESGRVDVHTGEIVEGTAREIEPEVKITIEEDWDNIKRDEEEPVNKLESFIDAEWLKEQISFLQDKGLKAWSNRNIVSYLKSITGREAANVTEAVKYLSKEQAENFIQRINDARDMA